MYNSTGGSILAVAVFHAGVNAMSIFYPADTLSNHEIPGPEVVSLNRVGKTTESG